MLGTGLIMSIYATLWHLQFPHHGDAYLGCEWVDVLAQGVRAHIGTPTPGYGDESGDPYEAFLPPALRIENEASEDDVRAVVFVVSASKKGTARSGQDMSRRFWCSRAPNMPRCRSRSCTTGCARLCAGSGRDCCWKGSGLVRRPTVFEDGSTAPDPPVRK